MKIEKKVKEEMHYYSFLTIGRVFLALPFSFLDPFFLEKNPGLSIVNADFDIEVVIQKDLFCHQIDGRQKRYRMKSRQTLNRCNLIENFNNRMSSEYILM